jgi:DNA polymerase III gamma/tau subunit
LIAKISEGCVRDAVKYVDQVSILGNLNEENVTKFLGIASEERIKTFIQHIADKKSELLFADISHLAESGVDLQHFAKQVLMYLDAHLFENIDLYLSISEQFGEILAGIRNYPYPALMYKIVLHKHIQGNQESKTEAMPVRQTVSQVAPVRGEEESTTKTPVVISEAALVVPETAAITSTRSTPESIDLWTRVIESIEKDSLKKSLKDLSSLVGIQANTATIMVINKFAQMALESHENRDYIEQLLSQQYGSPLQIKVQFQSKEDFFAGML